MTKEEKKQIINEIIKNWYKLTKNITPPSKNAFVSGVYACFDVAYQAGYADGVKNVSDVERITLTEEDKEKLSIDIELSDIDTEL